MTSPASFEGPLPGRRGRAPAIVIALIAAFIALAIAKPWSVAAPSPASSPSIAVLASPPGSTPAASLVAQSPVSGVASLMPIVLEAPPRPDAAWTGIGWRRLVHGDPLAAMRLVRRTTPGYLAVGTGPVADSGTLVWTSPDGATWTPVPSGTGTTFWPGSVAVGAGAAGNRMVVLTGLRPAFGCGPDGTCSYLPGVVAWTSADGVAWEPNPLPSIIAAGPRPGRINVASGPHGLVAAWAESDAFGTPSTRLATSADGDTWDALPATALPPRTFVVDVVASGDGYIAVGQTIDASGRTGSIVLRSADGRSWRRADPPGSAHLDVSLVTVPGAVVALGRDPSTGIVRWWRSADGARWTSLAGYPPLGPAACRDGCGAAQDGLVIGDGTRLLAMRAGSDGAAWTSPDGSTWGPLRMSGDVPPTDALGVTLLPGGVLVEDGTTTWYGAASGG